METIIVLQWHDTVVPLRLNRFVLSSELPAENCRYNLFGIKHHGPALFYW